MMRSVILMLALGWATIAGAQNIDSLMRGAGMVDVGAMDTTIIVRLMYASEDNFVGEDMYGELRKAYLHPEAAEALLKAAEALRRERSDLRLLVKDAARPMSVQRQMYAKVRGTAAAPYVSNPARGGGLHNYGLAVDVTLADMHGCELPMGTPVDHLGPEANIDRERELVERGVITPTERANRELLRRAMRSAGFMPLRSEWWHFNLRSRAVAKSRYKVIE